MVVLNIYAKTEPLCISKKLGLYISNLPNEEKNNWNSELVKEMYYSQKRLLLEYERHNIKRDINISDFYHNIFPNAKLEKDSAEKDLLQKIVDNMICIYMDYNYEDMPLGDWKTNCFDGRFCEEDYAEKIIDFINFLSTGTYFYDLASTPQWIYSSNHDFNNPHRIFCFNSNANNSLETLKKWGTIFDNFLQSRNDYLQFDYLINSFYKNNEFNEFYYFKLFSICQLFLEKDKEYELDKKLPKFFDNGYTVKEKEDMAGTLRRMRNKIAHGDFISFENIIEEYAIKFMDGRYSFDYSEYSRKNWVLLHTCCLLEDIIREIISLLFYEKDELLKIKNNI